MMGTRAAGNCRAPPTAPCQRKGGRGAARDEMEARRAETVLDLRDQEKSRTKEPKSSFNTAERSKAFRTQT